MFGAILQKETKEGFKLNQGISWSIIGSCYLIMGRINEAIQHYERALAFATEIGFRSTGEYWNEYLGFVVKGVRLSPKPINADWKLVFTALQPFTGVLTKYDFNERVMWPVLTIRGARGSIGRRGLLRVLFRGGSDMFGQRVQVGTRRDKRR